MISPKMQRMTESECTLSALCAFSAAKVLTLVSGYPGYRSPEGQNHYPTRPGVAFGTTRLRLRVPGVTRGSLKSLPVHSAD
jgi:hypothetical protein